MASGERKKRKERAIRELFEYCKQIEELKEKPSYSPDFLRWRQEMEAVIERFYGKGSDEAKNFTSICFNPPFLSCRRGDADLDDAYIKGLEEAREMIVSWMESLSRSAGE